MQGTYGNNGLPRPYYMKPKKGSYDNIKSSQNFFNTPRRKVFGYLVLLILFGSCVVWVSHDLNAARNTTYEIVGAPTAGDKKSGKAISPNNKAANSNIKDTGDKDNLNNIVKSVGKADKESSNKDLAGNLAQGSKGKKGIGLSEAPKGGVANEAPIVGSDEDVLIGTGKNSKNKKAEAAAAAAAAAKEKAATDNKKPAQPAAKPKNQVQQKPKGYKAEKGGESGVPVPAKKTSKINVEDRDVGEVEPLDDTVESVMA